MQSKQQRTQYKNLGSSAKSVHSSILLRMQNAKCAEAQCSND